MTIHFVAAAWHKDALDTDIAVAGSVLIGGNIRSTRIRARTIECVDEAGGLCTLYEYVCVSVMLRFAGARRANPVCAPAVFTGNLGAFVGRAALQRLAG